LNHAFSTGRNKTVINIFSPLLDAGTGVPDMVGPFLHHARPGIGRALTRFGIFGPGLQFIIPVSYFACGLVDFGG